MKGKWKIAGVAAVAFVFAPATVAPACGCVPTPPIIKEWLACSYRVAGRTGEKAFMERYAISRATRERTSVADDTRWARLLRKLEATCGSFGAARSRDLANGTERELAPRNALEAVVF